MRGHDLHGAIAWIATAQHGFVTSGGAYRLADAVYGAVQGDRLVAVSLRSRRAEAGRPVAPRPGAAGGALRRRAVAVGARATRARPVSTCAGAGLGARRTRSSASPSSAPIPSAGSSCCRRAGSSPPRWCCELPRPARAVARRARLGRRVQPRHRDLAGASRSVAAAEGGADGEPAARRRSPDLPRPLVGRVRRLLRQRASRAVPRRRTTRRATAPPAAWARLDQEIAAARARGGRVFCVRVFDDADRGSARLLGARHRRRLARGARRAERGAPRRHRRDHAAAEAARRSRGSNRDNRRSDGKRRLSRSISRSATRTWCASRRVSPSAAASST